MRGIVLGIEMYLGRNNGLVVNANLKPADLRRYLLYWDVLDYPNINGFNLPIGGEGSELYLLQKEGILFQSTVQTEKPKWIKSISPSRINDWTGDELIEGQRQAQFLLAKHHNDNTHALWSVAQTGYNLNFPINVGEHQDSVEVSLYNCLPSPGETCPIEDVLKFRQKRKGELLRFRSALDRLIGDIEKAENKHRATEKAKEEIELSLYDLHRLLDESRIQKIVSHTKMYLDLKDTPALTVLLALAGTAGAGALEISKELGALAGLGFRALLEICSKKTPKVETVPEKLRDFAYLYEAEKIDQRTK